jgi:uncharacterized protein YjbI with pentapeptide repeats
MDRYQAEMIARGPTLAGANLSGADLNNALIGNANR